MGWTERRRCAGKAQLQTLASWLSCHFYNSWKPPMSCTPRNINLVSLHASELALVASNTQQTRPRQSDTHHELPTARRCAADHPIRVTRPGCTQEPPANGAYHARRSSTEEARRATHLPRHSDGSHLANF
jgi:hypothetical protein